MSSINKVVLAGATGSLGAPVLDALLSAGFEVTVFTRPESNHTFPSSVKVFKADYSDAKSLTEALKGQDAVISTITHGGIDQQYALIDASIAAGVKRIIPSEFGSDTLHPKTRKFPFYKDKLATQAHLAKGVKGTDTTYTLVLNNAFLDWCIEHKLLIDLDARKIVIYDGGENLYSVTTLATVAQAVVGVLRHPAETANRAVKVQDIALTQNRLFQAAKNAIGSEAWTVEQADTAEIEAQANKEAAEGRTDMGVAVKWLMRAIFAEGYGSHFVENDNALLGITEIDDKDVSEIIKKLAPKA